MATYEGVVPKHKEVKITGKARVKPIKNLGKKECQLVTFDLPYIAFYYNQKFLLYKVGNGFDFEGIVGKLKDGLAVVLEEFHQLAGKLGKDEDGVFKVEYDDDMEGVEVIDAIADDVSVDDLTALDQGSSGVFKDMIPYTNVLNLEGLQRPLLSVQLTKLKDGLAMGLAFNHAILDGTATWHFMSSWAEICTGSPTITVHPFLERTKARNTRVKLDLSLPPTPNHVNGSTSPDGEPPLTAAPPLRERVFKFSDAVIAKIKSNVSANADSESSKPFSTFQSLSVHIWRHVTAARELKPEDYTVFTVFADCRNRVDPPMPARYFGNLIQAIFTVTAAGMLLVNPPGFGASLIQNAIESHNAKAIDERNTEWEKAPKIFEFKDAGVNCVAVGSSPRFKVYSVDFGFGQPEIVRSGSNNRFDGMVYLYEGKKGGIDVEISLKPQAMERLEKNKEFLMEEED